MNLGFDLLINNYFFFIELIDSNLALMIEKEYVYAIII